MRYSVSPVVFMGLKFVSVQSSNLVGSRGLTRIEYVFMFNVSMLSLPIPKILILSPSAKL